MANNLGYIREEVRVYELYFASDICKDDRLIEIQERYVRAHPEPLLFDATHSADIDSYGNVNTGVYKAENLARIREGLELLRANDSFCRSLSDAEWKLASIRCVGQYETKYAPKKESLF